MVFVSVLDVYFSIFSSSILEKDFKNKKIGEVCALDLFVTYILGLYMFQQLFKKYNTYSWTAFRVAK